MKKLFALILACIALGLVAAGCGGGDGDDNGSSDSGGGDGGASNSGESSGGAGAKVGMANVQFDPKDIAVKAGETSGPGKDFSSGDTGGMQQGDTFELKLDDPGKYEYVCNVHAPGMAGTITVK